MSLPFAVEIVAAPEDLRRLVAASWLASYRTAPEVRDMADDVYDAYMRARVSRLLDRSRVVAALADGVAIGWACGERASTGRAVLHYAYVKRAYRQHGLGARLLDAMRTACGADDRAGVYTHRRPPWSLALEARGWRHRPDYARRGRAVE